MHLKKSIDKGQPAKSGQADLCRYFFSDRWKRFDSSKFSACPRTDVPHILVDYQSKFAL